MIHYFKCTLYKFSLQFTTVITVLPNFNDIPFDFSPQLGGTVGDIEGMPYIEAFRQFQFRVGKDNFCVVHVSLIPEVWPVISQDNLKNCSRAYCSWEL